MASPTEIPWSDNPNAPQIPYFAHFAEKAFFAGCFMGAIFYGIVVVLFFQCLGALLRPINRTSESVKWGLIIHTMVMFSCATIYVAMYSNLQSISFVDHREFTVDDDDSRFYEPVGYQYFIYNTALSVVPHIAFLLNSWLADGLLLYRCCIMYAMNYWVIAFPGLMYLASIATGISLIYYQITQPTTRPWTRIADSFNYPVFSISLSLNILVTLMIVTRLILHRRKLQSVIGASTRADGLYKTTVTMLIESAVLYAVSSLLFIGPWAATSFIANIFFPILVEAQVIAPFLVIIRVANRTALTSGVIVSRGSSAAGLMSQTESARDDEVVTN